ncbi:SET domain-containing protein [Choiromyces venosus 120613-1]|uniref:SET domain-containing protein n=1 Tax=Choiromyces venosus 120613-1 TaxID=1336337 RepID=A0A3N4JWF3_9PEZI|nr:SET domain-containing protein [Choiromyces venosus 120613-1]
MSTRVFSTDETFNAFGQWLISHGGFIHESLSFAPPEPDSQYGSRVVTSSDVPPNSRLVSCPHTLTINYTKACSAFSADFISNTTQHAALRMFLCLEWLNGKESLWWPYLRVLPREFDTPLYFSDEDLKYLQGCNLDITEVEARKAVWKEEFEAAVAILQKEGHDVEGYTWELYLCASTVFTSRSFPGKLMNWDREILHEDDTMPVLFPLIDSLNHYPITKITWQPSDTSLSIISGAGVLAGAEVYNNYGPKPNEELLMGYGFTLPENPFDSVLLKPPRLTPSQLSLLGEPPTGLYHLTRRNRTPENPSIYPPSLLSLIYILTSTPSEATRISTHPAKPASKRNEISAHITLLHALLRKYQNFPAPNSLPPPRNSKQASAKIYADSQRSIVLSAIAESKGVINSRTASLVRLPAALAEGGAFAEAIEACFGSADEEELTEAGHDDTVHILYLCYLSLTQSDLFKLPACPPEEEAMESARQLNEELFPIVAAVAPEVFGRAGWTVELLHRGMKAYADMGIQFPREVEGLALAGEYAVCLE